MRVFKLNKQDENNLKTYTVVVDGARGNYSIQPIWEGEIHNPSSYMNIRFTVDSLGEVVDVEVQVND